MNVTEWQRVNQSDYMYQLCLQLQYASMRATGRLVYQESTHPGHILSDIDQKASVCNKAKKRILDCKVNVDLLVYFKKGITESTYHTHTPGPNSHPQSKANLNVLLYVLKAYFVIAKCSCSLAGPNNKLIRQSTSREYGHP